jgi:hypothetical protein
LWEALAGEDAARARRAVRALADAGDGALTSIRPRLLPPSPDPAEAARPRRWIAELDHDDPRVRDAAHRALAAAGLEAIPAMQAALAAAPSAEVQARLERLTALIVTEAPFPVPAGEPLRRHRAIDILERIGTQGAREVLERLSREAPAARERREARAALERLVPANERG